MNRNRQPVCWIVACPNGAGKTTFALNFLPQVAGCNVFVNADLIAAGIEPLVPEGRALAASRVFLREVSRNIQARHDFGFETTLSGLAYRQLIKRLRSEGWRVELIYLALPSVEMAMSRVAERVLHGATTYLERTSIDAFPAAWRTFSATMFFWLTVRFAISTPIRTRCPYSRGRASAG